ncbi:hypothetical protein G7046_g6277 [Stylonectria norvegica]|nr:hypothetical protein G7046_g6277 [Stylonectria norvegica]
MVSLLSHRKPLESSSKIKNTGELNSAPCYITASSLLRHNFFAPFLSISGYPRTLGLFIFQWQRQKDQYSKDIIMNPCAAAFTPNTSSSETSFDGDGFSLPRFPKSVSRSSRSVRRTHRTELRFEPDALDPNNYDAMFPALSGPKPGHVDSIDRSAASVRRNADDESESKNTVQLDTASHERRASFQVAPETQCSEYGQSGEASTRQMVRTSTQGIGMVKPAVYSPSVTRHEQVEEQAMVQGVPALADSSPIVFDNAMQFDPFMPPTPNSEYETPSQVEMGSTISLAQTDNTMEFFPTQLPPPFFPGIIVTPPLGPAFPYYHPPPLLPGQQLFFHPTPMDMHVIAQQNLLYASAHVQQQLQQQPQAQPLAQPQDSWTQPSRPRSRPRRPPSRLRLASRPGSTDAIDAAVPRWNEATAQGKLTVADPGTTQHRGNTLSPTTRPVSSAAFRTQADSLRQKTGVQSNSPSQKQLVNAAVAAALEEPGRSDTSQQYRVGQVIWPDDWIASERLFQEHLKQEYEREEEFREALRRDLDRAAEECQKRAAARAEQQKSQATEHIALDTRPLHGGSQPQGSPLHLNAPPANAPTGPSSFRRGTNSPVIQNQPALVASSSESGTWSQSKRWMSQETKERLTFQRLVLNLHYIGADNSPFVPQSPAELTAFKADIAEKQRRKLAAEVDRRLAKSQLRKDGVDHSDKKPDQPSELFGGKKLTDGLSTVFAADSCFNNSTPTRDEDRIDWPTLAELKEEGDKRAGRYGRYFPLPRLNAIADRIMGPERENAFNPDGSIRWEKKEIKLGARHIPPISPDVESPFAPPIELTLDELPYSLQNLLNEIDVDDSEGEHF